MRCPRERKASKSPNYDPLMWEEHGCNCMVCFFQLVCLAVVIAPVAIIAHVYDNLSTFSLDGPISSDEEHRKALERITELWGEHEPGSPTDLEFNALVDHVVAYEEKRWPLP